MKKLYRQKGKVHPSTPLISDHLAFLPAAIFTLAAALAPEDREVLAYLISSSSGNFSDHQKHTQKKIKITSPNCGGDHDHPSSFNCNCFRCYTSYWVRWDSSPNRQTIHEIIDAFEDDQLAAAHQSKKDKISKKERRKRCSKGLGELKRPESVMGSKKDEFGESQSAEEINNGGGGGGEREEEGEKGSVGKFVSFVGEKFWSVWT